MLHNKSVHCVILKRKSILIMSAKFLRTKGNKKLKTDENLDHFADKR